MNNDTPNPRKDTNRFSFLNKLWLKIIGFGFLGLLSFFIWMGLTQVPPLEELENPKYDLASIIYDVNGVAFGRYYIEDRVAITYDELSTHVKTALLCTEDERFFEHNGIDLRALARVGFKTLILRQESAGGGSTITQQLAKLLFKRPDMSQMSAPKKLFTLVFTKLKEWVTAVKIERNYTKEEIMAMYLNKFEFINGAHGIEAAAQIYFNKNQKNLSISEAATLVGMLKNPSFYNPNRFIERCTERRNIVLSLLVQADYIKADQAITLQRIPLDMSQFARNTQSEGPAPYFRAELTKWVNQLLVDKNIKKADGSEYHIYTDGLKIYTTVDLTYQKYAEEAVSEHMKWNQERYWKVWKNKDPWTFDTDDAQKKIRLDILDSQLKGTERYLDLRKKYLGESLTSIDEQYIDLPMSDNVIKAIQEVKTGKTNWGALSREGVIETAYANDYINLMQSPKFEKLYGKYLELQAEFEKIAKKPIKMMIFDYSKAGEKEVEMSPYDSVRYHRMHLQAGFLAVDPSTGHVKAWVGGINHKYFKYDHTTMRRSVGSTMKPFVYTQAIAVQGISPCQEFDDIQYTIAPSDPGFEVDKEWSPANANEEFTGNKYNLFHGLLYSKNSITVRLVKEMGTVNLIRDLLQNVGIPKDLRLPNGRLAVPNLPSICLGAVDLTLMEMTGAYSAFGNNGTYVQPIFVTRIEDKNGKVIYQGIPNRKSAINPLYNSVMVELLKNNVAGKFGLGIKSPIGGKTGTTNDYTDGWFMGVTPTLVTGVWTGGDDKWIRFLTLNDGQGYVMARPISQLFLKKLEKDTTGIYNSNAKFPKPPPGFDELIDCAKYKFITPASERKSILNEKLKKEDFEEEF